MQSLRGWLRRGLALLVSGIALFVVSQTVMAFGQAAKFVVADNRDTTFSFAGAGVWSAASNPGGSPGTVDFNSPAYGWDLFHAPGVGGTPTAWAIWDFGLLATAKGPYAIDVYVPAIQQSINTAAEYEVQSTSWSLTSGCDTTWATVSTFTFNQSTIVNEGQFRRAHSLTLDTGLCYRVRLSNAGAGRTIADAIRVERLFESRATIPDMPFVNTAVATGTTNITSASNASPTIVTTLSFTCPYAGQVLVTASGESAAQSGVAGSNFIGLAYSISRDSTATDNANVVQSSALAVFNGDANRDFLNVQRVDSCTAGTTYTYRLTAYRAQAATSTASFVWNGRLVAQYFP